MIGAFFTLSGDQLVQIPSAPRSDFRPYSALTMMKPNMSLSHMGLSSRLRACWRTAPVSSSQRSPMRCMSRVWIRFGIITGSATLESFTQ